MKKTVFISGATGGIGSAIAQVMAERGFALQLHYHHNQQKAFALQAELVEKFQIPVSLHQANLASREETSRLIASLVPKPDMLIHNAGQGFYGLFTDITPLDLERMTHLQLTAPILITQAVLPTMIKKRWGRIVFITSIWGETGASCETLYSMLKGGLISLTKSLAKEVAPSGITVNAVSPGAIATEMMAGFNQTELSVLTEEIPIGRLGEPLEVAHAVRFLTEEFSAYTTGQIFRVNGGWYT